MACQALIPEHTLALPLAPPQVFSSGLDYKHIHSLFKSGDEGKEKVRRCALAARSR